MEQLIAFLLANFGLGITFVILLGLIIFGGLWLLEGFSDFRVLLIVVGIVLLATGILGMMEFPFEQWRASGFW